LTGEFYQSYPDGTITTSNGVVITTGGIEDLERIIQEDAILDAELELLTTSQLDAGYFFILTEDLSQYKYFQDGTVNSFDT